MFSTRRLRSLVSYKIFESPQFLSIYRVLYKPFKNNHISNLELKAACGLLTKPKSNDLAVLSSLHTTLRNYSNFDGHDKDDKDGRKNGKDNEKLQPILVKVVFWMFTTFVLIAASSLLVRSNDSHNELVKYVSWNEFVYSMLSKGEVEELIVRPDMEVVTIILHDGAVINGKMVTHRMFHMNVGDIHKFEEKLRKVENDLGVKEGVRVIYDRNGIAAAKIIMSLLMAAIILSIIYSSTTSKMNINLGGFVIERYRSDSTWILLRGEFYDYPHEDQTWNIFLDLTYYLTLREWNMAACCSNYETISNIIIYSQLSRANFTLVDSLTGQGKGVKFDDVAGLREAKVEIMEFVDYLKRPERYKRLGARIPKGALLLGPPGCGKTLLAKAVATEANVPFLSMNGSEFVEMIGGLGAARVRDLFKEANARAPSIVYIDEMDAVGRARSSGTGSWGPGGGESEQTLNQLLVEMDGMKSREGVVVLASTNRADVLDKALLRPGRFDRHILIDLPTLQERQEIFQGHLKNIVLERLPIYYVKRLACLTPGFSGADIANVCNEAALHAARYKKNIVCAADLEYAISRVVGGSEKRSHSISPAEKKVIAYHESGHALIGWLLEHTDALLKVTIVPRTNLALGFAQYTSSDQKLYSKEELFDKMCMALGGRVAEAITFNSITSGAKNDLEKVTKIAYAQVRVYGMSPVVGLVSFPQKGGRTPFSKHLKNVIDLEARKLIANAYYRTEGILKENDDKLKALAEELIRKETLDNKQVELILGPPPYPKKKFIEPDEFELTLKSLEKNAESSNAPLGAPSKKHKEP